MYFTEGHLDLPREAVGPLGGGGGVPDLPVLLPSGSAQAMYCDIVLIAGVVITAWSVKNLYKNNFHLPVV